MKESKAEILCDLIDPERRGEVTRSDVCVALKCWPNQQAILKDINVLETDMPAMKRNSIIHLILESKLQNKTKKGALDKVKEQLDQIYGPSWNCYIAEKNYWFVCSHRPGSNLAFTYKGYVYDLVFSMNTPFNTEKLLLFYDELTEAQAVLPVKTYLDHLIKWGMSANKAAALISMVDPRNTGYIKREDICRALNFSPTRPTALQDVSVISTDMPGKQRDSIILLVLEILAQNRKKAVILQELKERLEIVYGGKWSCFIAEGRYWSICSHKPGKNLVFSYRGYVYGVSESPDNK
ncbi:unnamed protein product [Mesocestoides corti]|uniref:EF-hand domain-containing protein n=2 Tax=Mesocestoides corti TaxID=53468 RepID=A0A0R3UGQ2_MESCO|nr:unnamed protein product [Mesocestoides corti]